MAKSNRSTVDRKLQTIYSGKRKVLVGRYLTKSGEAKLEDAKTKKAKQEVWDKYGKNRYATTDAKPIKVIRHRFDHVKY